MISRPEVNKRMSRVTAENIKHAFSIFPTYIPSTSLNFNLQISSNIFKSIQIARFPIFFRKVTKSVLWSPSIHMCSRCLRIRHFRSINSFSRSFNTWTTASSFTMQLRSASHQVSLANPKVEVSCPNLKESRCCFQYFSAYLCWESYMLVPIIAIKNSISLSIVVWDSCDASIRTWLATDDETLELLGFFSVVHNDNTSGVHGLSPSIWKNHVSYVCSRRMPCW